MLFLDSYKMSLFPRQIAQRDFGHFLGRGGLQPFMSDNCVKLRLGLTWARFILSLGLGQTRFELRLDPT